jgi:hypothetical protein
MSQKSQKNVIPHFPRKSACSALRNFVAGKTPLDIAKGVENNTAIIEFLVWVGKE